MATVIVSHAFNSFEPAPQPVRERFEVPATDALAKQNELIGRIIRDCESGCGVVVQFDQFGVATLEWLGVFDKRHYLAKVYIV